MGSIGLCALAVTALLAAEFRGSQAAIWVAKPIASAAFLWTAAAAGAWDSVYGRWILLGLALCMAGDVLLIPRDRPSVFRAGVLAFLLGHVAYAAGFLTRPLAPWGLAAGAVLLAAALTFTWRWLAPSLPADMVMSVRAYFVVIGVMAVLACGVTAGGGPLLIVAGALAFTASDVSVARDRFVKHDFLNRAWGLPLYYAAQVLLALSTGQ